MILLPKIKCYYDVRICDTTALSVKYLYINCDYAMRFIYLHKYNINSAVYSSDIN